MLKRPVMQCCILALLAAAAVALPVATSHARIADAPQFVAPEDKPIPKGTRVDVVADRLTYDKKTEVATATGTVQLTYGPYVLTATMVSYNMKTGVFSANGSVVLREPNGNVLEADSAELKENFKEGFANHVKALLTNDVTITAQYAQRYEDGIIIYERATYTACKDCVGKDRSPAWQIVARQAKHDTKDRTIYYDNARLEVAGVPVFWTPYLAYPDPTVKRRTGFLLPSFKSGGYGIGMVTPYFWDIAPNMDLTVSPMWTTQQGPLGDVEFRHRLAAGMYTLRGSGIYELNPDNSSTAEHHWRGAARTTGSFRINDTWNWGWDGTTVSDKDFLSDYDLDDRNMLASYVQATGLSDRNYTKAQMIHWQTLVQHEEQSQMPSATPFVTGDYVLGQPVLGGEMSLQFNAYSLEREQSVDDPGRGLMLGTQQTHAEASAAWKRQMIQSSGLVVTPFAQLRSDFFFSQGVPDAEGENDANFYVMPTAGLDVRMPFVGSHGPFQSILTPVAQIIAAPSEEIDAADANEDAITLNFDTSNLFLSDRFTGYDRREGGVRANAGVNYTLLGASGGFLRASFGESFHIAGENSFTDGSGLNGTSSNLVGAVAIQMTQGVTLGYQARVEEDLSRINTQEAALGLTLGDFTGSVGYADVKKAEAYGRPHDGEQIWGEAEYIINEVWSIYGGLRYDLEEDRLMQDKIGLAYDIDCMRVDLAYAMSRDDEFGVNNDGKEHRVEVGVELRTIGDIDGEFSF
jgi:LPS-assembly protein